MLCPPLCFPAIKREIHAENSFPSPCTPPASFPRIKGSQQCYNTSCIPPSAVGAGGVVASAAAAVATALTAVAAVAAVAVTAVTAAVVVAGLQWKQCTGGRPPLAADFARGPSC